MNLIDRFLKYVSFDTTSNPESKVTPSSNAQRDFALMLAKELEAIGLEDVSVDEHAYVMGTLTANNNEQGDVIGFIAHMDTSPDMSGKYVKPRIIANYNGKEIALNLDKNITLSPSDFPELSNYIGQDLIVTDGNTLLGADDKAGIAEIITAMEQLINHPEIKHGKIRIAFTPDEEIGHGASLFDINKFGAHYAYTIDGGEIGELEYENFNAAGASVVIRGRNVHPGYAKGKMINSMQLANEFITLFPSSETPETTEGYEGFFHLTNFEGTVEESKLQYIIRDHERTKFEVRKKQMQGFVEQIARKYGENSISLEIKDQYYNMKEKIEPQFHIVDLAKKAMEEVGVKPIVKPIRGGTDGAQLSFKGLLCPNIFAGGHNFHGKYEYIPVQSMQKAVDVIVKIAELAAKRSNETLHPTKK